MAKMLTISTIQPFAAVSRGAGFIDIVAIGTDSQMYHKAYDESGWQEWENLGGEFSYEAPALVASSSERLDLFARDKTSKNLMRLAWDGKTWETEWHSSQDLQYDHRFTAASWGAGRVDVLGLADDRMYHQTLIKGSWEGNEEDWYAPFQSNLALTSWSEGHLDVYGVGNDTQMWQKTYDSTTVGWGDPLGGWYTSQVSNGSVGMEGDFASDPMVVAWPSHQLHLFVVGSKRKRHDTALYRMYSDGSWADYKDIGGTFTSSMAAVAWGEGRLDVVGRGTDMNVWHRAFDSKDGEWQPHWKNLDGGPFGSAPIIVSQGPNRLDIFAIAQNDSSFQHLSGDGNTWGSWTAIGRLPSEARVTPFASDDAWTTSSSAMSSSGQTSWASNTASATSTSAAKSENGSALGTGAVAGIAIGGCVAVAIAVVVVFLLWRRRRKTKSNGSDSQAVHTVTEGQVSAHRADAATIHEVQENQMKHMLMSHAVADTSGVHELGTAGDNFPGARR